MTNSGLRLSKRWTTTWGLFTHLTPRPRPLTLPVVMSDLDRRQQEIVAEFSALDSWEDRYKRIISLGKELDPLAEEFKIEDNRVKGCQSQVWMVADLNESGQIVFQAESDAMIVNGLIALLLRVFSPASPQEILNCKPNCFGQLGLQNHLSPSRANGLNSMLKQIYFYAAAFDMKMKSH